MQLTTPQLYALFSMLIFVGLLIGLSYCTGLRTGRAAGYEQGRETGTCYWKWLMKCIRGEHAEMRGMLAREEQLTDSIRRQLKALRTALHQEQSDNITIVRDLLEELERERANSLTLADHQTLTHAALQLGNAAALIRRIAPKSAKEATEAQHQVNEIAGRVHAAATAPKLMAQMADSCITDTDLIEWLDSHAACCVEPESAVLEYPATAPYAVPPHLRDILVLAVAQQRTRQREDQLDRAEALGTWERVDEQLQPATPTCM
ncbi:hypothetical protein MCB86_16735 [Pseudomonas sp. KSR10]|uniref:hypothetical protein n=1 Tax=Pseudomonas sp. KSR10 TaxID=2916654 RepID=UPI001EF85187|nr:hypothetical protein [Pseudomonas sp. KSR10]MCG6541721.1 hypothetical protein [Pseudomonas sp. KSR10]